LASPCCSPESATSATEPGRKPFPDACPEPRRETAGINGGFGFPSASFEGESFFLAATPAARICIQTGTHFLPARSILVYPLAKIRRFRGGVLLGALLWSVKAFAALGGDARSVESDASYLAGSVQVQSHPSYTVHEIQTPTGTRVREYVSPAGTVFAIAWQGPWPPNLHQLLGSYFNQFQQAAAAAKRGGRAPVSIRQNNLVVEHSGHMRAFRGRAYLSDQLPAAVSEESIR
jgi:Protein of unknown function (DUF2844)